MEIKRQVDNLKLSILSDENYIGQIDGVAKYGYVCSGGLVLPYIVKRHGPFIFVQLPSIIEGSCGNMDEKSQFINGAVKHLCLIEKPDAIYTLNTAICTVYPENAEFCKFGSYIVDLQKEEDVIFAEMHSKHRNVIRKAEKDGLRVDFGPQYSDVCYEQIKDTYERQHRLSYTKEHFEKLKKLARMWIFGW